MFVSLRRPSRADANRSQPGAVLCALVAAVMVLTAASACAQSTSDVDAIPLPMGYVANVQFSPFYVAKKRGYLQNAGYDVTFDYRFETDGIQLVASGEIPYTVASGDQVIQARSNGLPVRAIAGWYQSFPVGVVSLEATPLDAPGDLAGLTVGIPETFGASYIGLLALLDVAGLTEDDIDLQAIGYTQVAALTAGTVDAVVVYRNNAPAILATQGIAYNGIWASDYVSLVSVGLVSSDQHIADEPEATQRFVDAFLRGLADVLADPDAAFEISDEYIEGLEENAPLQRAVLERSIDLWQTSSPGLMSRTAWEQAQAVMAEAGMIRDTVPVDELFTNAFIPPSD